MQGGFLFHPTGEKTKMSMTFSCEHPHRPRVSDHLPLTNFPGSGREPGRDSRCNCYKTRELGAISVPWPVLSLPENLVGDLAYEGGRVPLPLNGGPLGEAANRTGGVSFFFNCGFQVEQK